MFKLSYMHVMRGDDERLIAEAARLVTETRKLLLWSRSVVNTDALFIRLGGHSDRESEGQSTHDLIHELG